MDALITSFTLLTSCLMKYLCEFFIVNLQRTLFFIVNTYVGCRFFFYHNYVLCCVVLYCIVLPDITAPGVDIIASYSEGNSPTELPADHRRIHFNVLSSTSMSCLHVSGVVGLLKTLYPDWSLTAIKSAILTTETPNSPNTR